MRADPAAMPVSGRLQLLDRNGRGHEPRPFRRLAFRRRLRKAVADSGSPAYFATRTASHETGPRARRLDAAAVDRTDQPPEGSMAISPRPAADLFTPLTVRSIELRNRVGVSPMCQYSSDDGFATDWHLVHLGAFARGGAALVMTEGTAVLPEGRISPWDLGIWKDDHIDALRRITAFVRQQGAAPGIQLAHAGRKASLGRPWESRSVLSPEKGGWDDVWAASAIPFADDHPLPRALDVAGISGVIESFVSATGRALDAGFEVVEIHASNGHLLHSFLSPLANRRTDRYGGSFENRARLLLEVTAAVRREWPDRYPLLVRMAASDWAEGGWALDDSVRLARLLRDEGVDLIDCTSGGLVASQQIAFAPGFQVPFAERIRREAEIGTIAVGLITDPHQANAVVTEGRADMVFLAREMLRNPHWPLHAAHRLGASISWPPRYERARQ